MVPKENILRHGYQTKSTLFQATESIRQKRADSIDKSIPNSNFINKEFKSASTRTTTKKVTKGLSQVKEAKRKRFSSSAKKCVMEKRLRSFLPLSPTSSFHYHHLFHIFPQHMLIARLGLECGLWKLVELRTKRKYSVIVTVTTTDAATKIQTLSKVKARYQQIHFTITEIDLDASEFKLHKEYQECWQDLWDLKQILPEVILLIILIN